MKNKKKTVMVVLGGNSKEREISILTGKACARAIKDLGFNVVYFDPKKNSYNTIDKEKVDIIFNALHGKEGEDGIAQTIFEYLKIPYTHSGVISSMQAMDKVISKKIFIRNKINTPKYSIINNNDNLLKKLKWIIKTKKINFPLVIKPTNEGSSIGVKICKNLTSAFNHVKKMIRSYENLIVENFIGGQEIQVAVLNGKALGAIELRPKRKFYDYKAKYYSSAKTDHIMPAELEKKKYNEVLKIAEKAHKILKCEGVTRSDFKFFNNKFYLLELNTQPGMTKLSLVPEIAAHCKITFELLIKKLLLNSRINK